MADGCASAETLRIQGSSAFANQILMPYQARIERVTSHQLKIATSKASVGVLALFNGEADLAMVSAPPGEIIEFLKNTRPDLPVGRLRSFLVSQSRVAFAVNSNNPVRHVPIAKLEQILTGQINNWRELGGPDLAIRVVSVTDGGGARLAVQNAILGSEPITASYEIRAANPDDVVKAIVADRGALGIAETALVNRHGLPQLNTGTFVSHPHYFVSLGEPTDAMREIIVATRRVNFDDNP